MDPKQKKELMTICFIFLELFLLAFEHLFKACRELIERKKNQKHAGQGVWRATATREIKKKKKKHAGVWKLKFSGV